jgi:hypothetical protein
MSGIQMYRSHCSSLRLQLVNTPKCSRFTLCKSAVYQAFLLVTVDTDIIRQSARIDLPALSNNNLPGRIIDYVVCLTPNSTISSAYRTLQPLAANTNES